MIITPRNGTMGLKRKLIPRTISQKELEEPDSLALRQSWKQTNQI